MQSWASCGVSSFAGHRHSSAGLPGLSLNGPQLRTSSTGASTVASIVMHAACRSPAASEEDNEEPCGGP